MKRETQSWLEYFASIVEQKCKKRKKREWTDREWTEFMGQLLCCIGKKMKWCVVQRRLENRKESGEYLNIDAMFFHNADYEKEELIKPYGDPLVLPCAIVELENDYSYNKISYCLWKILCVRASIKVLVCYQKNAAKVKKLKQYLEKIVRGGRLMKETKSDLLIMVGDESKGEESEWDEYFDIFEWQKNGLRKIKTPVWNVV